jgi:hypothetical protein
MSYRRFLRMTIFAIVVLASLGLLMYSVSHKSAPGAAVSGGLIALLVAKHVGLFGALLGSGGLLATWLRTFLRPKDRVKD